MKINQKEVKFAQLGDEVLKRQALMVADFQSIQTSEIIKTMMTALLNSKGVGLAAPQIFHSLAIVIIASRPSKRYPLAPEMEPIVMINPSFKVLLTDKIKDWEGCLSVSGVRALVPRYKKIKIDYFDQQGHKQKLIAEDFIARIFQHEYDHLNGLVYLDRVEDDEDIISEAAFQEMMQQLCD